MGSKSIRHDLETEQQQHKASNSIPDIVWLEEKTFNFLLLLVLLFPL